MKAIVYDKAVPGKLEYREAEQPAPAKGEVLIRVRAVSINAADYRSMKIGIPPKHGIYGADVAGTVVQLGDGVTRLAVGDEVMGDLALHGFGGFAEYAVAPERILAKKPDGLSFEAAATVSLAGVTALQGLRMPERDLTGLRVLILGAGGGVGTYAVQLAKRFGACVTATCSARNLDQTLSLGADRAIDYAKTDALAEGEQYDLILGVNGKQKLTEYYRALLPNGMAVIIGGALTQVFATMAFGQLYAGSGRRLKMLAAKGNAADSAYLGKLAAEGNITPVIERIVPLAEAAEAFHAVAKGHARGKVVVKIV